jgi:hypothetical protein
MKAVRFMLAALLELADPRVDPGSRQPDLHRQVPQPHHRNLLELHPADQHRQRDHRQLRWAGRHPQPVEPGLQLRRQPDHRPVDRLLGAGAPRRGGAQALLPGVAGWHRPRSRHLGAAAARFTRSEGDGDGGSFYQAHFYVNPVLYWLEVVTDFPCLERGSFDLAYLTEVDPLWNDDELTLILNPEAVLFANPVAVAACAADCVAATAGFGIAEMFWCAGCQGGIYPFDGHVPYHMGGVRTAELLAQRLTAKMHRELLAWGWHGKPGLCGPYFLPAMDKTAYKAQLTYPVANTAKDGGRCCQPFGRSTIVWGAGKEYPVRGEDFAFMLFRKRNCCVGY